MSLRDTHRLSFKKERSDYMIEIEWFIATLVVLITLTASLVVCIVYLKYSKNRRQMIKKALDDAKKIKMNALADAKAEAAMIFLESENNLKLHKEEINIAEMEIAKRKHQVYNEIERINIRESQVLLKDANNSKLEIELNYKIDDAIKIMEDISGLSVKDIEVRLKDYTEKILAAELDTLVKNKEEEAKKSIKENARSLLIDAMEKYNIDVVVEKTTSIIKLDSEDYKGRIIGKEGRNIKVFEQYGGVDIIIDEVPNTITISSFNPIRREIAVRALNSLIKDGRIQPQKIEEALIYEEQRLDEIIMDTGKEAAKSLGIFDLNIELIKLLGKLKYRTSYGQNALQHCLEVGSIAGTLAAELDLDPYLAKKAGLLHDIGKAVDFEQEEGSHVSLGVQVLKRIQEDEIIINAVAAHHGDTEKTSHYAELVVIADTISAARPGARNNNVQDFFVRMDELEKVVKAVDGVLNAFVLQAGRQIRVIVDSDIVDDTNLNIVSKEIQRKVKETTKTPGETVITVIRERRTVLKV